MSDYVSLLMVGKQGWKNGSPVIDALETTIDMREKGILKNIEKAVGTAPKRLLSKGPLTFSSTATMN